jgi:hypothetical protein
LPLGVPILSGRPSWRSGTKAGTGPGLKAAG